MADDAKKEEYGEIGEENEEQGYKLPEDAGVERLYARLDGPDAVITPHLALSIEGTDMHGSQEQ